MSLLVKSGSFTNKMQKKQFAERVVRALFLNLSLSYHYRSLVKLKTLYFKKDYPKPKILRFFKSCLYMKLQINQKVNFLNFKLVCASNVLYIWIMSQIQNYLNNCLYFTTSALSRKITKMAEESFKPIGLTPSYAFLLMVVNEEPGIEPKLLSKKLNLAPSTVTRFVDKLVYQGYLSREMNGKNILIHPEKKCGEIMDSIHKCWKDLYNDYCGILGEDLANTLNKSIFYASNKIE